MTRIKCPQPGCNKFFLTQDGFQAHLRTHQGLRPFPCPLPSCGKSFDLKGNLKAHIELHKTGKPHVCHLPECGKSFRQAANLRLHLRNSHNVDASTLNKKNSKSNTPEQGSPNFKFSWISFTCSPQSPPSCGSSVSPSSSSSSSTSTDSPSPTSSELSSTPAVTSYPEGVTPCDLPNLWVPFSSLTPILPFEHLGLDQDPSQDHEHEHEDEHNHNQDQDHDQHQISHTMPELDRIHPHFALHPGSDPRCASSPTPPHLIVVDGIPGHEIVSTNQGWEALLSEF